MSNGNPLDIDHCDGKFIKWRRAFGPFTYSTRNDIDTRLAEIRHPEFAQKMVRVGKQRVLCDEQDLVSLRKAFDQVHA